MKRKLQVILFLMLGMLSLNAQLPNRGCGTLVPGSQYDSLFQQRVIDFLNANSAAARVQANYQVPVIIHVIHNGQAAGTFPNLAQGQINSQIQVLNEDYSGVGFNSANYPTTAFQTYATNTVIAAASKDGSGRIGISNTGISFCLALKDSLGNTLPEPGIERMHWNTITGASNPTTYTTSSAFTTFMNSVVKPATIWSPNKYLNIWITDISASIGLMGYTAFPPLSGLTGISGGTGNATTDGLWCWAKVFGSQNYFSGGTYSPPFNYGRTATHELSHYFGVRHIWGDGTCLTDYCNDTPPQQAATFGTATYPYLPNDCPTNSPPTGANGIMFMNFADYTDDAAMYMFTDEQKVRMQTAMVNSPYRNQLGTHGFCSSASPTVIANFSISPSVIYQGQSVSITDMSTSTSPPITAWNYFSAASTVTSSTLQNPTFTFNSVGVHTISLTVTSAGTNASTTKTLQVNACPSPTVNTNTINVSCAGLCNGSASMLSNGGTPFSYSWTPSVSSSSVASGLCAGVYTCVVTNSCGVSVTKVVTVTSPSPLIVNINTAGTPACLGNSVNLTSSMSGGSPSYTLNWSTGSNLSSITVTPTIMPITVIV
jgi:PKD repeat protein